MITLNICSKQGVPDFKSHGVTHLVTFHDPAEIPVETPIWVRKENHVRYSMHDVEEDATSYQTPKRQDIEALLSHWKHLVSSSFEKDVNVLIHCHAGIGRSPSAAYALQCLLDGPSQERESLETILKMRPCSWFNLAIVGHADDLLEREGRMVAAIKEFRAYEIAQKKITPYSF